MVFYILAKNLYFYFIIMGISFMSKQKNTLSHRKGDKSRVTDKKKYD